MTLSVPDGASAFCVAPDHPCLPGHFPGRPLVPAVLILDEVAARLRQVQAGPLLRVVEARFSAPLRPGEVAHITLRPPASGCVWRFEVRRGDTPVARGRLEVGA